MQDLTHPSSQQPRQSVMNTSGYCPNDNCNSQPTAEDGIQPCDNDAVSRAYTPINEPPAEGGGGGVTTACSQHWGYEAAYDNEGNVIGYTTVYRGCF